MKQLEKSLLFTKPVFIRRMQQLESLLKELLEFRQPADREFVRWLRHHPKAGSKDRAELADVAFHVLRHLRRYQYLSESDTDYRRLALLGLAAIKGMEALKPLLTESEWSWLHQAIFQKPSSLPYALRFSLPDWLLPYFQALPHSCRLLDALNQPAPMDLRINPLLTTRDEVMQQLLQNPDLQDSLSPTPYSPWGIRLNARKPVHTWPLFQKGHIEVQDEGSQILAALLAPRRGETVIDFCAGAGGKTLLLGALMRSTGRLYAFDISAERLARAKPRFERSGLSNIFPVVIHPQNDMRVDRLRQKAHRVLVDAPCSGLGTLRRSPDLKWRLQASELEQLVATQANILARAAQCLAPGGRLVYATCSVLPIENQQQVTAFLEKNPDFELESASDILAKTCPGLHLQNAFVTLLPDQHGCDGFFAAVLRRR